MIGVWERQRNGRIHFHLVVVLADDIRTGFDFAAVENQDYRSACPALRREWAWLRRTAKAYRFGRTELLPVKSTAEGIARYVGKYVAKHIEAREEEDKGARVVRFIGYKCGERTASAQFGWNNENGWLWRHKLAAYARKIGAKTTDDLYRMFGPRWAYLLQAEIIAMKVEEVFPSESAARRSECMGDVALVARVRAARILESSRTKRVYTLADGAGGQAMPSFASPRPSGRTTRRANQTSGQGAVASSPSIGCRAFNPPSSQDSPGRVGRVSEAVGVSSAASVQSGPCRADLDSEVLRSKTDVRAFHHLDKDKENG
jgi:hypothetical protein